MGEPTLLAGALNHPLKIHQADLEARVALPVAALPVAALQAGTQTAMLATIGVNQTPLKTMRPIMT